MIFVTAGMGSGTGTGGASVVPQQQNSGALTVGVITTPLALKGKEDTNTHLWEQQS